MRARRIRVAQIITSVVLGGGGQVICALARHLDRGRFDVDVYCVVEGGEFVDYLESLGVPVKVIPVYRDRAWPKHNLVQWYALAQELLRGRYHIVHTHLYRADLIGRVASLVAGPSVRVKTLHNMGEWKTTRHKVVDAILNRVTERVICVSEGQRAVAIAQEQLDPARAVTIYNGVDMSRFDHDVDRAAVAASLGLDATRPIVGTVGRLIPQKRHEDLIRAIPEIVSAFPETQFLIVGDGPLRNELRSAIARITCARVVITGLRADIPQLLKLMNVFVFPSISEAFGIALTEAMAANVPVVCSRIVPLTELVEDGRTGLLFQPRDCQSLARAVCRILGDPNLGQQLRSEALVRVRTVFSEERMARKHEELYISRARAAGLDFF